MKTGLQNDFYKNDHSSLIYNALNWRQYRSSIGELMAKNHDTFIQQQILMDIR